VRRSLADSPFVILTTTLPRRPSEVDSALRAAGRNAFFDAVDLMSHEALDRLKRYAKGNATTSPLAGFWPTSDLQ